jgi:4-phytase / acid phosphatase
LVFERLRDPATGSRSVRISFVTPALDQIREASTLDAAHPPEVLAVLVPGCGDGQSCPLAAFGEIVKTHIDPSAAAQPEYR